MVFMEYATVKILHMECCHAGEREIDRKSNRMEGVMLSRGMQALRDAGLIINEVVTDASKTFISFFSKHDNISI